MNSSVDPKEIEKFERIANEWWDVDGKFKPLHQINPIRLKFIKNQIDNNFKDSNISIIDLGSGGGLVSEHLAKMNYDVFGIDASKVNIDVATHHARNLECKLKYQQATPEEIVSLGINFDVVLALEIIEHVSSVESFLDSINRLLKPGGILILSTINRNIKSFFAAIVAAEYILNWLPKGTHEWSKFLKPSEISNLTLKYGLDPVDLQGINYNMFTRSWYMSNSVDVNYIMTLKKRL